MVTGSGTQLGRGANTLAAMTDDSVVEIRERGPAGDVRYAEGPGHVHDFWWEFLVGEVIVGIRVPSPAEWPAALPWAAERRDEVLQRIGEAVVRARCKDCRFRITERSLEILGPARSSGSQAEGPLAPSH